MFIKIDKNKIILRCSSCNNIFEKNKTEELSSIFLKQEIIATYDLTCPNCNTNFNKIDTIEKIKLVGETQEIIFDLIHKKNKTILYKTTRIVNKKLKLKNYKEKISFNFKKHNITYGLFKKIDINNVYPLLEKFFNIPDDVKIINSDKIIQLTKLLIEKDIDNSKYIQKLNRAFNFIYQDFFINFRNLIKLDTVVFSIFLYQNLSTILIEKDILFLFNLIKDNKKVTKKHLIKLKLTSPVKIFSELSKNIIEYFLIDIYQEKNLLELINIKSEEKYLKKAKIISTTNEIKKITLDVDKIKLTKFIFKNIDSYEELKRVILMFKFFNLSEIVYLFRETQNNQFILKLIEKIIDRDQISTKRFLQLYNIIYDFCYSEYTRNKFQKILRKEDSDNILNYIDDFDFSLYDDTIMMLEFLNISKKEFNQIKTYSQLIDFHNKIVEQFNALKNIEEVEKFKEFTKSFEYLNYETKEIKVRVITDVKDLIKEGREMRHSAGSYSKKIAQRQYLILSVFFENERATLGLIFNNKFGLRFHQLKGVANSKIKKENIEIFKEYLKKQNIDFSDNDIDLRTN